MGKEKREMEGNWRPKGWKSVENWSIKRFLFVDNVILYIED